jgi:hypothetical protein
MTVARNVLAVLVIWAVAVGAPPQGVGGSSPESAFQAPIIVGRATSQSIPDGAATAILWTSEISDTGGLHDTASNQDRLTAGQAGLYHLEVTARFVSNSTGIRGLVAARHNSSGTVQEYVYLIYSSSTLSGSNPWYGSGGCYLSCSAGDYVKVLCFQNRGGGTALDLEATDGGSPPSYFARAAFVRVE